MMYGLQTRINKEINVKTLKSHLRKDKSNRATNRIKEYDNLKKIIKKFIKEDFPYISYVYGGYKDIHDESIKYSIPLLNHDDSCYLCLKKQRKSEKFGFFTKIFKKKEERVNTRSMIETQINEVDEKLEKAEQVEQKELNHASKFCNSCIDLSYDGYSDKIIENLNNLDMSDIMQTNQICTIVRL
jgi:hypothetical protein